MNFTLRDKHAEEVAELSEWHRWYAWYPVKFRINNFEYKFVWFDYVERQANYERGGDPERYDIYRIIGSNSDGEVGEDWPLTTLVVSIMLGCGILAVFLCSYFFDI